MAGRKETQPKEEKRRDGSRSRRSPARTESKTPTKSKSPARTKSPSRKSPSRASTAKQAAVSPSRRSPARKSPARSPARKSPTRNVKGVEVVKTVQSTVMATKEEYLTILDSDSDSPDIPPETKEKPKIAVRGRSRNADIDRDSFKGLNDSVTETKLENESLKSFSTVLRRSTRRSSHSADMDFTPTKYDVQAQKLTEFSDDEVVLKKTDGEKASEASKLVEFGGTIGAAFFIVFLPLFVYGVHIFCNESQCSFKQLPDLKKYTSFSTFFNFRIAFAYFCYFLTLNMLTMLPIGKRVSGLFSKHERLEYVANAPISLLIFVYMFVLEFYGIGVTEYINAHYFHFILPAFIFGVLFAIYCYLTSFNVRLSALTTNSSLYQRKLYNFFMGREINPVVLGVMDLKIWLRRTAIFSALLLSTACFFQAVHIPANKEPLTTIYGVNITLPEADWTIFTVYALISVYYLDALIWETRVLSTFEIQYEGFGYMSTVGYALYPFFLSSLVRYVYYNSIQLQPITLIISGLYFVLGFYVYRTSNVVKDAFRNNPYQKSVAHLETITTNLGKKLIVSGLWGTVRKPNYLGDILMHLSLVPFVYNAPPVLFLIFTVALLVHRAARDNAHCKQKYGGSWERYCLKVKHVLLPKVY